VGGGAGFTHEQLLHEFAKLIPVLDGRSYKGQHGKVGIVGGCVEYTGAPFFASQSSMLVGCDMSYIIAMPEAAAAIKGFSPDMMVVPWLPPSDTALEAAAARDPHVAAESEEEAHIKDSKTKFDRFRPRMTSMVLGPGLGDQRSVAAAAAGFLSSARNTKLPFIVDGSGISSVIAAPHKVAVGDASSGPDAISTVQGCRLAVLTPNVAELGRIAAKLGSPLPGAPNTEWQQHAQKIAAQLAGPVLVSKGPQDIITDGRVTLTCAVPAALKRCGGQGDVVAGVTGTFMSWAAKAQMEHIERLERREVDPGKPSPFMLAAYAGCTVVRNASAAAFADRRRAMLTPDIIEALPTAFEATFPGK